LNQAIRNARSRFTGKAVNQRWVYASPRVGLIWRPLPDQRLFVNVSRSDEAPTYWEIITPGKSPREFDLQRADTVEIGGAGKLGGDDHGLRWSLAYYYSEVEDELMSISNELGTPGETFNYKGGTRHQGVELGLNGHLPATGEGAD